MYLGEDMIDVAETNLYIGFVGEIVKYIRRVSMSFRYHSFVLPATSLVCHHDCLQDLGRIVHVGNHDPRV